ncbi:MAG TPA: deoxynucleoside kinase [Burkholderiales bacterium]|nr:deoxynucleoside kinase [Burkholderiales bacterium]
MNLLDKSPYIAIEGPIGAGKTSLATRIARHLEAELLLENADDNPFLARFYQDPKRHALATQLFFLFQRSGQVNGLRQNDLFRQALVSDFLLDKDPLFAEINLDDEEFRLYQKIYRELHLQAPVPALVIYLQAKPAVLLNRIRRRGIAYENNISTDYLELLSERYARYFHRYDAAPLLIVNCEQFNFVDNDEHFALLMQQIADMRSPRVFLNQAI